MSVIEKVNYNQEMEKSYIDYAMSVIVQRALPDVRDGLKPVHRRILFAMHEQLMTHDKPFKKSARIVGEVIGKFHPHGDSAVYETMVRLSQDFHMNLPLIEGHGNFGSIDGDGAAAMRYTEARLSKTAEDLLADLAYKVVDVQPNFDNSLEEPIVLPTRLPNLLINGAKGIAVGMTTDIPAHNPKEVLAGVMALLKNPDITTAELVQHIPAPDFPTGGIIVNPGDMANMYETGSGRIVVRAKTHIEPATQGKSLIVVTEIPYTYSGNKAKFIQHFIDLVRDKKLEEIVDVRDESDREGIRVVLETRRGVNAEKLLSKLFQKTALQDTASANFLAIERGVPKVMSLKAILEAFVSFQTELLQKKYTHLLNKAMKRKEIVEGLVKAVDVIDPIIELLRGSKNVKQVRTCLTTGEVKDVAFKTKRAEKIAKSFRFTAVQADAILDMKLQRLIQLEMTQLEKEYNDLLKMIGHYEKVLGSEKALRAELIKQMKALQSKYDIPRKTSLDAPVVAEFKEEILPVCVTIDAQGYVKKYDDATAKRLDKSDSLYVVETASNDKLYFFTSIGNVTQVKMSELAFNKSRDKGTHIEAIMGYGLDDIVGVYAESDLQASTYFFGTKDGFIKQVAGAELLGTRKEMVATKLSEADEVMVMLPVTNETEVLCTTEQNKALRFTLEEVPILKKNSVGVKSVSLTEDDRLASIHLLQDKEESIWFRTQQIPISSIPLKKRAGRAVKVEVDSKE